MSETQNVVVTLPDKKVESASATNEKRKIRILIEEFEETDSTQELINHISEFFEGSCSFSTKLGWVDREGNLQQSDGVLIEVLAGDGCDFNR